MGMSFIARITLLLFFFSLCVGGAILSLNQNANANQPETRVIPVNNPKSHRQIWLWV
jgi:hypothetical protein